MSEDESGCAQNPGQNRGAGRPTGGLISKTESVLGEFLLSLITAISTPGKSSRLILIIIYFCIFSYSFSFSLVGFDIEVQQCTVWG